MADDSSSSSSEDETIEALRYRFSGYQLELIQLDETGPAYAVAGVHPYYKNQPEYWAKPYQTGGYWDTSHIREQTSVTITQSNTRSKSKLSSPKSKSKAKVESKSKTNKSKKLYQFNKLKKLK